MAPIVRRERRKAGRVAEAIRERGWAPEGKPSQTGGLVGADPENLEREPRVG